MDERTASLKAVVDHAAEGIITTDANCVIRSFNAAAERMFGVNAAEAIGRDVGPICRRRTAAGSATAWTGAPARRRRTIRGWGTK